METKDDRSALTLATLANCFELRILPGVFVLLAFKDLRLLWQAMIAFYDRQILSSWASFSLADLMALAHFGVLVGLVALGLLPAYLLSFRSSLPRQAANRLSEIIVPILSTFAFMGHSLLLTYGPVGWDSILIPTGLRVPALALGLLFVFHGIALALIAQYQLGSSFGVLVSARTPVMTGLYASLRHPMYGAYGLIVTGVTLLEPRVAFVLWTTIFLLLLGARAYLEERKLSSAFVEYREYQAHTPAFFPKN